MKRKRMNKYHPSRKPFLKKTKNKTTQDKNKNLNLV